MDYINYDEVHNNINEVGIYWGEAMPDMTIEELAELIQAISKVKRHSYRYMGNLIEEIADVYISLAGLCDHYNIGSDKILDAMNTKLKKSYDNPDKIALLIHEKLGNNPYATRISNALIRNRYTSEEKIRQLITKENWWREVSGLGKEGAKYVEMIFSY